MFLRCELFICAHHQLLCWECDHHCCTCYLVISIKADWSQNKNLWIYCSLMLLRFPFLFCVNVDCFVKSLLMRWHLIDLQKTNKLQSTSTCIYLCFLYLWVVLWGACFCWCVSMWGNNYKIKCVKITHEKHSSVSNE